MPTNPREKIIIGINPMDLFVKHESRVLYITNALRRLAESMIGIFIPVYIFTRFNLNIIGLDTISSGFITVFLLYGLKALIVVITMEKTVNLIFGTLNFKRSIVLGNACLGIGLLLLGSASTYPILIFLSMTFLALNQNLYWIPYHTFFIRKASTSDGKFGVKVSLKQVFDSIASIAGPLLGALIIKFFGFEYLFILGFIILVLSGIPFLLTITESAHGKHNSVKVLFKYIKENPLYNDTIAFAASGIDAILFHILSPMLIFLIAGDVSVIGIITAFSIAISLSLTLKIGAVVDQKGPAGLQRLGITINTALYIIRAFATDKYIIYSADLLDRLNNNLLAIPFISSIYRHAKSGRHESDFVIYRAYITEIAVIISMVFATIFVFVFKNWQLLFLFLAAISPLTYAINATNPNKNNLK